VADIHVIFVFLLKKIESILRVVISGARAATLTLRWTPYRPSAICLEFFFDKEFPKYSLQQDKNIQRFRHALFLSLVFAVVRGATMIWAVVLGCLSRLHGGVANAGILAIKSPQTMLTVSTSRPEAKARTPVEWHNFP
jgi:hypothetical protein